MVQIKQYGVVLRVDDPEEPELKGLDFIKIGDKDVITDFLVEKEFIEKPIVYELKPVMLHKAAVHITKPVYLIEPPEEEQDGSMCITEKGE